MYDANKVDSVCPCRKTEGSALANHADLVVGQCRNAFVVRLVSEVTTAALVDCTLLVRLAFLRAKTNDLL